MAKIPASTSNRNTPPVSDADLQHQRQELGMLGRLFGNKDQAPINISGFIVLVCVIGLALVPFAPSSPDLSKTDMAKSLGSLILASLTFLGGYMGASKRR